MRNNRIAFKVVFSLLVLAGFTSAPIFTKNKQAAAQNTNKAEYEKLLAQCRAIRDEVVRLSVEEIKATQERYMREFREQALPPVAERFAALGEGAGSSSGFKNTMYSAEQNLKTQLDAISVNAYAQIPRNVASFITIYLQRVGTPVALQLLNDLVRVGFIF